MIIPNFASWVLLAGFAAASIPTPPTTTIIDISSASLNGYPIDVTVSTSSSSSESSSSRSHSSHSRTRTRTSKETHHTSTECPTTDDECTTEPHRHHHHKTRTVTSWCEGKPVWLLICPCSTNTSSMITTTVTVSPTVAPTSAVASTVTPVVAPVVAPVSAAAPVCTPCTNYVTTTVQPSLVCTTMVFCDIADQSSNCAAQNVAQIESIVSIAARQGGQIMVNGELVVFSSSGSTSVAVVSGTSVLTVTGQDSNAAAEHTTGFGAVGFAALLGAALLFA